MEEGWWSGTLNNKLGLFPSNFVKELELTEDGETHEGQDESGRRKNLTMTLSLGILLLSA